MFVTTFGSVAAVSVRPKITRAQTGAHTRPFAEELTTRRCRVRRLFRVRRPWRGGGVRAHTHDGGAAGPTHGARAFIPVVFRFIGTGRGPHTPSTRGRRHAPLVRRQEQVGQGGDAQRPRRRLPRILRAGAVARLRVRLQRRPLEQWILLPERRPLWRPRLLPGALDRRGRPRGLPQRSRQLRRQRLLLHHVRVLPGGQGCGDGVHRRRSRVPRLRGRSRGRRLLQTRAVRRGVHLAHRR